MLIMYVDIGTPKYLFPTDCHIFYVHFLLKFIKFVVIFSDASYRAGFVDIEGMQGKTVHITPRPTVLRRGVIFKDISPHRLQVSVSPAVFYNFLIKFPRMLCTQRRK